MLDFFDVDGALTLRSGLTGGQHRRDEVVQVA